MAKDAYDYCVEYLTENPEKIRRAWSSPHLHAGRGGELFAACNSFRTMLPGDMDCGCPTMVKGRGADACTPELTAAIVADDRIPSDYLDITPAHLPVFAEWQRRLDKELGRTPPAIPAEVQA